MLLVQLQAATTSAEMVAWVCDRTELTALKSRVVLQNPAVPHKVLLIMNLDFDLSGANYIIHWAKKPFCTRR